MEAVQLLCLFLPVTETAPPRMQRSIAALLTEKRTRLSSTVVYFRNGNYPEKTGNFSTALSKPGALTSSTGWTTLSHLGVGPGPRQLQARPLLAEV